MAGCDLGPDDEHDRLVGEVVLLAARGHVAGEERVGVDDGDVGLQPPQRRQGRLRLVLEHEQLGHRLRALAEPAPHPRQQHARGGGEDGDAHGRASAASKGIEVGLRRRQAAEDHFGMLDEQAPRGRQPERAPTPLQELESGLLLERRQLLRDRRPAEVRGLRRRPDRAVEREVAEEPDPAHVEQMKVSFRFSAERRTCGFAYYAKGCAS